MRHPWTWITREVQDAANAAYRAGLTPLFDDDDEVVSLRCPSDDEEIACLDAEIGKVSIYTNELIDYDRDHYAFYCGRASVLAAIASYARTGSFRLGTPDGAEDEVFA